MDQTVAGAALRGETRQRKTYFDNFWYSIVSQYILFWWKDMKENNTLCWGCWLIWPYSAVKQAQCRMQRAGCILPWREEYYGRLRSEGGWSREQKQHANTLCGVSKYLVQELLVGGNWTSTSFIFWSSMSLQRVCGCQCQVADGIS